MESILVSIFITPMCSFVYKKGIFIREYDALKNSNLLWFLSIDLSRSESLSLSFSL